MPGQENPSCLSFSNLTAWHDATVWFERRRSQVTKKEILIKSKGKNVHKESGESLEQGSREAVESQFLQNFKICEDKVLRNVI